MKLRMVCAALALAGCLLGVPGRAHGQGDKQALAKEVRQIFTKYCYRCHGQNGSNEGGFNHILDFKKLVTTKVVAGNPAKSRLFKRAGILRNMPPEEETLRPSDAEIDKVKQWIEVGAPEPPAEVAQARPFLDLPDELKAMRDYLRDSPNVDRKDRKYIRFFTLRHLHNLPADKVRDQDLRIYQAALAKLINSLSGKKKIVLPEPVDKAGTVFAVDVRHIDWDRNNLWQEIVKVYPYALRHDENPFDKKLNDLYDDVYQLTGAPVPVVRADWFIATASRPPLYHTLLRLPERAGKLEKQLGVDVAGNFRRNQLARAGFNGSGVSGHNRLVERHEGTHGAYWKSYDFKTSTGKGNLFIFPLGPSFPGNEFPGNAFKHAGGEIIFSLPNGLHGYMLVNDKEERIDAGPIEIVSDSKKTSGTPAIVNGLSCMACHQQGMIRSFKDQVRDGQILDGPARNKVFALYKAPAEMDKLLAADEEAYLRALERATGPYVKVGADAKKSIGDFPEPISAIARWYIHQDLTLEEAARELGLKNAKVLEGAIKANRFLQEIGLYPLVRGGTVQREVWEDVDALTSPFQEAARELKLGDPVRIR